MPFSICLAFYFFIFSIFVLPPFFAIATSHGYGFKPDHKMTMKVNHIKDQHIERHGDHIMKKHSMKFPEP
jgi:hypothetical protein